MPHMIMDHEVDPKQKILEEMGDISKFKIFNNNILVAVYQRPAKTKSGLYLTDKTTDEDRFQSKVGLLIKTGQRAFEPNDEGWFDGETFNLNDWIVFRPSDGWNITVNGVLCRMLSDTQVRGTVDHPDGVW